MNPVWVAMGLSFQTVKKWLHDRGEPSCSGGRRGQVNCAGLRAGAKLRPPPLNIVRFTGDWESWIEFFADAVVDTATQAVGTAQRLMQLASEDGTRINKLGRVADQFTKFIGLSWKDLLPLQIGCKRRHSFLLQQ